MRKGTGLASKSLTSDMIVKAILDTDILSDAVRLGISLVTGNTEDFRVIQKTGINLAIENWR